MGRVNRKSISRRGMAMVYVILTLPVILAFSGLAVDVARTQVAKTQAQDVADAAARYASIGLATSSTPWTTAYANATSLAAQSSIDGAAPTLASADVVQGTFNASKRTFTANSTGNAIKVTVRQSLNRSGSAPLMMSIFNKNTQMVVIATAIAQCTTSTTTISPPASGNLWLSGMPNGTTYNNMRPDNSVVWDNSGTSSNPKQRPLQVSLSSISLKGGDTISLEGISGTASWENNSDGTNNSADGDETFLVANGVAPAGSVPTTSPNGMSNCIAPIGAVMAVFMNDNAPNTSGAPSNLDFATQSERDYYSIAPKLKQVFFVGDGKRSNGELQTITIPTGATRVFFGMMDAWQWNDNVGTFETNLYGRTSVTLVK